MAYETVQRRMENARAQRDLKIQDQCLAPDFEEGDLVYTRNHAARGRNKIQDFWDPTPYQIVRPPSPRGVVYSVAPAGQDGPLRQVHRAELRSVPEQKPPEGVAVKREALEHAQGEAGEEGGAELNLDAPLNVNEDETGREVLRRTSVGKLCPAVLLLTLRFCFVCPLPRALCVVDQPDVITTATYQASVEGFVTHLGISAERTRELLMSGVHLAREAVKKFGSGNTGPLVAGSIGSYGAYLHDTSEYTGLLQRR
ncbi:hypothetical protein OJAV_G00037880 [Oryzias javanicus]|uniref:Hcy-binding domain-containing protein n=1 Tax=Oryzias javanicus TaxID=123683 RepID=A0A437DGI4_ORYJA|nr:hypothetical protein OJAV_G00037880 [Oryzias javanicus]